MERIDKLVSALIGGILLPFVDFFYGGGSIVLYTIGALAFFILLDWMSGSRASKKDESYASNYGIDGVVRTFFMLMLPAGGHFLDLIFGLPSVFFGLLAFGLLYHTIQSMTANAIRAGWGQWVPEWMLTRLGEWVKSELDNKLQRSTQRKDERIGGEKNG